MYKIYALKYAGPAVSRVALVRWNEGWDNEVERYYYVWAAESEEGFTVVDTGAAPAVAAERKLRDYVSPVEALARLGADRSNIRRVVVTHIHFDHAGGVETFAREFPEAVFYVQRREFDFWTSDPVAKKAPFLAVSDRSAIARLADMEVSGRLKLVDGDLKITPGMELLLAPGHTVGLQTVLVSTAHGPAIIASDCAHVAESFTDDIPSCFITDLVAWMKTYDKLRARASSHLIFPGHDARMFKDYPVIAEDVTRLA